MSAQLKDVSHQVDIPKPNELPHKTVNDTDKKAKQTACELLNAQLASSLDLAMDIKQAHWNMRGPNFIAVHELMDEVRAVVDAGNDMMAERIVQLGGHALGTIQTTIQTTALDPYPLDICEVNDHLKAVIERMGVVANSVRAAIDKSESDPDTSDLFTEVSRNLDKYLWFLEAHVTP